MQFPKDTLWYDLLKDEFNKTYFKNLKKQIKEEISNGKIIYPPQKDVFNAFGFTDYEQIKVRILITAKVRPMDYYFQLNRASAFHHHFVISIRSLLAIFNLKFQTMGI